MRIYSKIFIFLLLLPFFELNPASKDPTRAKNGMVVSESEIASKVGVEILKEGGNAIDAAVAVGFALAVTYPSAGNIGGGGFMVIHLNGGQNTTIDFREKAPLAADREMYLDDEGNFISESSLSGMTSVGVPGTVAGLIFVLQKYGSMNLEEIIQPAINLANNGFEIDYRLAESLNTYYDDFMKYESSKKIFTNNGKKFEEGNLLIQKDLAATLELIKQNGKKGFYEGKVAQLIIEQSKKFGGYIKQIDLKSYLPVEREPVMGNYKEYELVSMGSPSSGGIALVQALNVLENFYFTQDEWGSSQYIHTLTEILKYVYADRSEFLGDEDFYPVPKEKLISKKYAAEIAQKISYFATPSDQINSYSVIFDESLETTHYCVVDKSGNAVSTSVTINSVYGNKIVVDRAGFLLNNEMDDFSSKPGVANQYGLIGSEANSIEPGKRMLSSMAPTIVLKNNEPYIIIGSPGGSTIITVVLQVILNCIDFDMDIQQAIDAPRIHHQWLPDSIDYEEFGMTFDVINNLLIRDHKIGKKRILGRAEGILIDKKNDIIWGATDPRGFGAAVGY